PRGRSPRWSPPSRTGSAATAPRRSAAPAPSASPAATPRSPRSGRPRGAPSARPTPRRPPPPPPPAGGAPKTRTGSSPMGPGWARRLWAWQPERVCGGSGGAGLGYGLPAALGVALAHRGSGKLCVNLQADGDLLYVVSGLYTAAHHRLPLLTVMFNNRTYGNDE